jgi:glycosyltransferase involved in cell wall biosynthesis
MKVYFPCGYFPPEKAASIYLTDNIVEDLANSGINVVVYTPIPTRGVDNEIRNFYKKNKIEYRCDNKLKIIRFRLYREGKKTIARAIRYFICNFKHFWHGLTNKYDVYFVDSTPPTQGLVAGLLKIIKGVKIVYNLQDVFPDSLVGTGITEKGSLVWRIGRILEQFTYTHCDKIIVISNDFKNNIIAKGVPEDKIEVIYNWVDEKAVVNVPRFENKLFDKYDLDRSKFYVTYNGNIGLTQNIDLLIDVAKELSTNRNIQFVLVGDGADRKRLENIIRENHIDNIRLLPFQPYEDISDVFSLGDVSLIISKPGVGLNSVPSKTWSIMSASRPVLANFDENELKDIIVGNHCGVFTKAGDKVALINAILHLYHNPNECKIMGENGRKFIETALTRKIGTTKYVNIIKNVVINSNQL